MKQQLEAAIEGKHSKLTEVYKALETECQNVLNACRENELNSTAAAAAAAARDGDAGGGGSRKLSDAPDDGCAQTSGMRLVEWVRLIAVLVLGLLLGSAAPGYIDLPWLKLLVGAVGVGGAQHRRRTAHVEEMRGWMPTSVAVPDWSEDMKRS